MATSLRQDRRYEPQLDGLRAFAVLAVTWSHWAPKHEFGIPFRLGVHLFFVLSGYLITRILLDIRDMPDRFHGIGIFYARRILRIFPAYYLTIAVAMLGGVAVVQEAWPWHVAYLSNILMFQRSEWAGMASHWWSLAVEEQFYLVWPCLIIFMPRRMLLPVIATAVALAPVFRAWLLASGHPVGFTIVLTPSAFDCLGAGALLALGKSRLCLPTRPLLWVTAACGIGLALVVSVWHLRTTYLIAPETLGAGVFAWVVWRASAGFGGAAKRVLEWAPVMYLGRISYGFYLIHNFAFAIFAWAALNFGLQPLAIRGRVLIPFEFAITLGLAAASWHFMEKPINDLKRFLPYRERRLSSPARVRLGAAAS